jgi:hypothetical protein
VAQHECSSSPVTYDDSKRGKLTVGAVRASHSVVSVSRRLRGHGRAARGREVVSRICVTTDGSPTEEALTDATPLTGTR